MINDLPGWLAITLKTYKDANRRLLQANTDLRIENAQLKKELELFKALGVTIEREEKTNG